MRHLIKYKKFAFCSVAAVFLLTSCATSKQEIHKVRTAAGVAPLELNARLRDDGVKIIQQGSSLTIVLPIDTFFRLQSIALKERKIKTLQRLAAYLKYYLDRYHVNPTVYISGHVDTVYPKVKRATLSTQYADVIASYLWSHGFSHRQLKVKGCGATKNIANINTVRGAGYNRRVVIQVN